MIEVWSFLAGAMAVLVVIFLVFVFLAILWTTRVVEYISQSGKQYYAEDMPDIIPIEFLEFKKFRCLKNKDALCSICLNEYNPQTEVVLLPTCPHIFHPKCLGEWLQSCNVQKCPYCRTIIEIK